MCLPTCINCIYCCITNFLQNHVLEQHVLSHIFYRSEIWAWLVGFSGSGFLTMWQSECRLRLVISGFDWGQHCFQAQLQEGWQAWDGRLPGPATWRLAGFLSSPALGGRPRFLSTRSPISRTKSPQDRGGMTRRKWRSFCDLMLRASPHFSTTRVPLNGVIGSGPFVLG